MEQVFAPDLGTRGVYLYPRVVGKPGHKGGNRFATVRREIKALIRQEAESVVTMFFDYYGLDRDWPGVAEAEGKNLEIVHGIMGQAIAETIAQDIGDDFNSDRFIPYVQLHEIESLLFASPDEMARVFNKPALAAKFEQIVRDCGGCERINNDPENAPSKRIQKLFPEYKKGRSVNAHAYRIALHIGVERIRQQCPHFNDWFTRLERLGE
jgi:hypothetical protein